MNHDAELIGMVRYYTRLYNVYRMPGREGNIEPWYYGLAVQGSPTPYCAHASLRSLLLASFTGRVKFEPLEVGKTY